MVALAVSILPTQPGSHHHVRTWSLPQSSRKRPARDRLDGVDGSSPSEGFRGVVT